MIFSLNPEPPVEPSERVPDMRRFMAYNGREPDWEELRIEQQKEEERRNEHEKRLHGVRPGDG